MAEPYNEYKGQMFPPAFPPPSFDREEKYIARMIQRDRLYETRDTTIPYRPTRK